MHYATTDRREHLNHGLTHDPFKAIVAPRPIAWVTTISPEGVLNLAPYSFFNAVSDTPPMVMFASAGRKDSLRNIEANGEFTCSVASDALVDQMNLSSATVASDVDEFALTGLAAAPSLVVAPPRVAGAPVAFECTVYSIMEIGTSWWVMGRVVNTHVDERAYVGRLKGQDHRVDLLRGATTRPVGRLGRALYVRLNDVETVLRRDGPND